MIGRPPLRRGDIIIVTFPFTDLSGQKRRPALIVGRVDSDDLLVAFITSQTTTALSLSTHMLDRHHPEFGAMGLKVPSAV